MFQLPQLEDLNDRRELKIRDVRMIGTDVRIIARTI
jgi:hypothetical protein